MAETYATPILQIYGRYHKHSPYEFARGFKNDECRVAYKSEVGTPDEEEADLSSPAAGGLTERELTKDVIHSIFGELLGPHEDPAPLDETFQILIHRLLPLVVVGLPQRSPIGCHELHLESHYCRVPAHFAPAALSVDRHEA